MPNGKPAGVRCIQLTEDNHCQLFGKLARPLVCQRLQPEAEMCGTHAGHALTYLNRLEKLSRPAG